MVKIMRIGSGCIVKSVCDLDREIAEVKSKAQGKHVEPEGSCHFSYGKFKTDLWGITSKSGTNTIFHVSG